MVEITRAFITGGAGFIGSRLAVSLKKAGVDVSCYDNFLPQVHLGNTDTRRILKDAGVEVIVGDVRDADALSLAVSRTKPQIVYHLAAETGTGQSHDFPVRYTDVNVLGTAHLVEVIRKAGPDVRRVVLAGSRSVYGEGACVDQAGQLTPAVERLPKDLARGDYAPKDKDGATLLPVKTNAECVVRPASIYASTKLMQERVLRQGFWGSDVDVGVLRLQNVYGPGQSMNNPYTGVLSIFCRQIMESKTLNIFEDGQITRDFVLVDDVVAAFVAMGCAVSMPSDVVDIGLGQGITILDAARALLVALGQDPGRIAITGNFRPGDIRHAIADNTRAANTLGWSPKVQIHQGLQSLADWSSACHGVMA